MLHVTTSQNLECVRVWESRHTGSETTVAIGSLTEIVMHWTTEQVFYFNIFLMCALRSKYQPVKFNSSHTSLSYLKTIIKQ